MGNKNVRNQLARIRCAKLCTVTEWFVYSRGHLYTCRPLFACIQTVCRLGCRKRESIVIISSGLQQEMLVCTEYLFSSVCLHVHPSSSPSVVTIPKHKLRLPHIFLSTHLTLNISFFLGKMDLNSLICQILLVRQQAPSVMCACLHLHENNLLLLCILGRKAEE